MERCEIGLDDDKSVIVTYENGSLWLRTPSGQVLANINSEGGTFQQDAVKQHFNKTKEPTAPYMRGHLVLFIRDFPDWTQNSDWNVNVSKGMYGKISSVERMVDNWKIEICLLTGSIISNAAKDGVDWIHLGDMEVVTVIARVVGEKTGYKKGDVLFSKSFPASHHGTIDSCMAATIGMYGSDTSVEILRITSPTMTTPFDADPVRLGLGPYNC